MSEKHTQGRLKATRLGAIVGGPIREYVNGSGQDQVAMTTGTEWMDEGEKEANARRLVACWNACDGIPTTDLEQYAALDGVEHETVARLRFVGGLVKQRDELLEALEVCRDALQRIREYGGHRASAEIVAEQAIANVKGGAA
jgi:hypothetical protein